MLECGRRGAPAWLGIMVMSFVLVGARSVAGDEASVDVVMRLAGRDGGGGQASVVGAMACTMQPTWR